MLSYKLGLTCHQRIGASKYSMHCDSRNLALTGIQVAGESFSCLCKEGTSGFKRPTGNVASMPEQTGISDEA